MLRKTTAAVVLAGALALGTASATSLGNFNDVTFAAGDVDLLDCEVTGTEILDLVPDVPTTGEALSTTVTTFEVSFLDLSILTDATNGVDPACLVGSEIDIVLADALGNVERVVTVDADTVDLSNITLSPVMDLVNIGEVRILIRDV